MTLRGPHITPLRRPPRVVLDGSVPVNPNLFTNPIPILNQNTPLVRPLRGSAAQQPYNAALYAVAVVASLPFTQSGLPPVSPIRSSPVDFHNVVLFVPSALPFGQSDGFKPFFPRPASSASPGLNPNLLTVSVPFIPVDFSTTGKLRRSPAIDPQFNPNLFTNPTPFNQTDFSTPRRTPAFTPFLQSYNNALYTIIVSASPFNQTDWSVPARVKSLPLGPDALNINLFTNPIPFSQYDWTKPARVANQRPTPDTLNPNLFTPFPFFQTDWSKPFRAHGATFDLSVPFNPNLANPVPFNQVDWAKPFRLPSIPPTPLTLNVNLFPPGAVQYPFSQYDYAKPFRVPDAPFDLSRALNPNLFTNPAPFSQYDWSKPFVPVPSRYPEPPLNVNLFVPPPPVETAGPAWRRLWSQLRLNFVKEEDKREKERIEAVLEEVLGKDFMTRDNIQPAGIILDPDRGVLSSEEDDEEVIALFLSSL